MVKLLYIGKSNKRFTHNKIYRYSRLYNNKIFFYVTVYYNSYQLMTFKDIEYFEKNFKLITEKQQNQLIRKIKLKRLNKIK